MRNDENYCNESTALETIAFNPKPLKKLGKTQETLGFMTSTPARTRTLDMVIKSHLLYQLSYKGG